MGGNTAAETTHANLQRVTCVLDPKRRQSGRCRTPVKPPTLEAGYDE